MHQHQPPTPEQRATTHVTNAIAHFSSSSPATVPSTYYTTSKSQIATTLLLLFTLYKLRFVSLHTCCTAGNPIHLYNIVTDLHNNQIPSKHAVSLYFNSLKDK